MIIFRSLGFLLLCCPFLHAAAQNGSGTIRGTLKDSTTRQVLPLATVTVFTAKDTTIVAYRLSDAGGSFKVPGIPLNVNCRVLVSFSGYQTYRKSFLLSQENPLLDMGTMFLVNDPKSLEEVIVYAERPPVSVRKDTIEFNASAFKTLPSALLEDLLKKLPGIDVDAEGNILVKGKRVTKLLVDGKEFFGNDPQIATKNLPADIVDKVQVMNDQEEIRRNPRLPESQIGQIINIKLKKGIKQGWFGKAYAGGGTGSRHEAGAILNAFRDTVQVSVLGYTNNINRAGFGVSDVQRIGGFERSGLNSMMISSEGGFSINDISLGGTGQGLQRSTGGGINFNDQFKKVTLNLQYFYGQINSRLDNLSNQQRFFKDTVLTTRGSSEYSSISINHRIAGTVKWKIDSLTTLTFRPGVTLTENKTSVTGFAATDENYRGNINSSRAGSRGNSNGNNYAANLFLDKNFKKQGRTFSVNADISSLDNSDDNYSDGLYHTYNSTGTATDSLVNQLRKTGGNTLNSTMTVSFAEPINKKLTLEISHSSQYIKQDNSIDFFSKDTLNGRYDRYNQGFSNGVERSGWKNTASASVGFSVKKLYIRPGVNYLTASYSNRFTKSPSVSQRFNYVYPSLNVYWGILDVAYSAYIREPPASDLQPVIDVSNRFYQQYGNPYLKPAFVQSLTLTVYKYTPESGNLYSAYIGGDFSNNGTIRESRIDRDGTQFTKPANVDRQYIYGNLAYIYQYKMSQNYKVSIRPTMYGSYDNTFISVNGYRSGQKNVDLHPSLFLNLNYKDKVELNQRYSPGYRQTIYSDRINYKNMYVRTHSVESELVIRMPTHVVWENLVNYTHNPQVAPGIRKSSVRWNAAVNYLFLKQDKGQLKLSVYDLLKQNINVSRYVSENYVSDTQNTTLTRYFLLTFTYNLRNLSGEKVGGKNKSMFIF